VLEGVAEVETALATLVNLRGRLGALDLAMAGIGQVDAAGATLHRLGLADDLDRASSTTAVLQARLERARVGQERSLAFIALYKALGGAPLPPDAFASVHAQAPR
jgi:outer membrane protein TolC